MQAMTLEKTMTPGEVAIKLRVTVTSVIRWIKIGKLHSTRVGKLHRISQGQLQDFIAACNR